MTEWRNRIVGSGEEAPDQLLANPANWRIHPREQQRALDAALSEVGWVTQVIVNRTTGHLVDGHLRVDRAMARGEATVPVVYVELTPAEEALVLATLDPLSAMAGKDAAKLDELLAEVATNDPDLLAMLEGLVGPKVADGLTDPDDVPAVPDEPYVQRGDVWLLGDHRVMCGDSTDAGDVGRLMVGDVADAMWTDPPYGVGYVGKTNDRLTLAGDQAAGLEALLTDSLGLAIESLRDGAAVYLAHPPGALALTFEAAFPAAGFHKHETLVWVKDSMVLGHSDYHLKHESIIYGWKPGADRTWVGGRDKTSVFEVPRPKASRDHPTGKPVALVEAHVQNSTLGGDTVLDPFLGSGSTLIAAEQLGRRCYGMEIDPRYAQVAIERWQAFTGRQAVKDGSHLQAVA